MKLLSIFNNGSGSVVLIVVLLIAIFFTGRRAVKVSKAGESPVKDGMTWFGVVACLFVIGFIIWQNLDS